MDGDYVLLVAQTMHKLYDHAQKTDDVAAMRMIDDYYAKLCELGNKAGDNR